MKIEKQIEELRQIFKTKRIKDESNKSYLTDDEVNMIIKIISSKYGDGVYYVSDDINLVLSSGYAKITDA